MEKIAKRLPPLWRPKISKIAQDKENEINKLYEANKWWNYLIFQLHWHKLERVNTRIQTNRKNPIQFLQECFAKTKMMNVSLGWTFRTKRIIYTVMNSLKENT